MKLPLNYIIEEICSEDEMRPSINNLWLEIKNGKGLLVATDGRRLVTIPVETNPTDTPGYVTPHAVRTARQNDAREIFCGEKLVIADKYSTTLNRPTVQSIGHFPEWRKVCPDGPIIYQIGLNAEFLASIQRAMGCGSLVFEVRGEEKCITIRPTGHMGQNNGQEAFDESATFLLMPCRVE